MARQGVALCNKINERLLMRHLGPKCFAQPKFNGLRGWVAWDIRPGHGGCHTGDVYPEIISSGGNKLQFFEHIEAELKSLNLIRQWDGEIYKHGMGFEDILSIARRTVNRKEGKLDYHIFDVKMNAPQDVRLDQLNLLAARVKNIGLSHIKVSPTFPILTSEWRVHLANFVEQGYEGIILRKWNGEYLERKSNNILKYKATIKRNYRIIAVLQGEGWCYDRAGSVLVRDDSGREFSVGSGRIFTADGRLDVWRKRVTLVGKDLTVRHEKEVTQTTYGKPRGCNAWEIVGEEIKF